MSVALEQQLRSALLADPTVSGFLGTRLYLVQLAQNPVYPAAAIQRISTQVLYSHHADAGQQGSVGWSRIQLTVWCDGPSGGNTTDQIARAILNVLYTAFNAYDSPGSPQVFNGCPNFLLNRHMAVEPQTSQPLFKAILDLKIWFRDQ